MSNADSTRTPRRVTLRTLHERKQAGERFAVLTAYDASFAAVLERAGVDVLLVGDSLGMVLQGAETTVPVTMDHMVYHARCVAAGSQRPLRIVDLPFMTYANPDQALANAARLMREGGAQVVKLEAAGDQAEVIYHLARHNVPVCAHLGLQPQSVHKLGGFRVQGRSEAEARTLVQDARSLQDAGADLLLVECIPADVAREITEASQVPVIGIGAGPDCDAQVLVLYDILGISPRPPRFAANFLAGNDSVEAAVEAFVGAVREGRFPGPEHSF